MISPYSKSFSANLAQKPNHILPDHLQEWLNSSVDPELIALNLRSLNETEAYEHLLYNIPNTERRNDGRLRDSKLKQYKHLENGGWWVSGLDPDNEWHLMLSGRLKPDTPRIDPKRNKPVKYESPPNAKIRLTYFKITHRIWDKVARRYSIKRYHSPLSLRLADQNCWRKGSGKKDQKSYTLSPSGSQNLTDILKNGVKKTSTPISQIKSPIPICFWEWVKKHPEIPIILTEGEKKAACLLSMGYVAIALPGIWNGARKNEKNGKHYLHPDLLPVTQKGREFIILFDYETKEKTRKAIYTATIRTGKLIQGKGCKCSVASLPGEEKRTAHGEVSSPCGRSKQGVDDFVTARGEQAESLLAEIIKQAQSLSKYQQTHYPKTGRLSDKYPANVVVNTKYLSERILVEEPGNKIQDSGEISELVPADTDSWILTPDSYVPFPSTGVIGLSSGMGTGKTELMAILRQLYPHKTFLNNGHRVNLLKNLAQRLNTQMYSEIAQGNWSQVKQLSITVDSLYKLQEQLQKYDFVFIDEACQYVIHLLHSNTCKKNRAEILEVLEYIIRNAKLVILADAHLDDITLDFFMNMRPLGEKPFIIQNTYQSTDRDVYWYEGSDNSEIIAKLQLAILIGQKIMVVADSKKLIEKLEKLLTAEDNQANFLDPKAKPLRVKAIHSDNSGSEENISFIKNISEEVKNLDVLLASPSLGTGVDINSGHFQQVFGIFSGVSQSATECIQQLHRVRGQVPLHIWTTPHPPFGRKETNEATIKRRILRLNSLTAFLIRIDPETGERGAEKDWALDAYCKTKARRNDSMNNLREDLYELLFCEMGYNLIPQGSDQDSVMGQKLKQTAQAIKEEYQDAIVKADNITHQEYQNRQSKEYLNPEQQFECEKFRIHRDYGMPVTAELVKLDQGGQLIRQLITLESMIAPSEGTIIHPQTGVSYPAPPKIVAVRDLNERQQLAICTDWQNHSPQWLIRQILGLPSILQRLLKGEELTANDPALVKMRDLAVRAKIQFKSIIGFTVPKNCKPMWLLSALIAQMGLKMTHRKKGKRKAQVRYYSLEMNRLGLAVSVLEHRDEIRTEQARQEWLLQKKALEHQAKFKSLYGIEQLKNSVSDPPKKNNLESLRGSLDTENNLSSSSEKEGFKAESETLKHLNPLYELLQETFSLGKQILEHSFNDIRMLKLMLIHQKLRFD
ncbi:hypothetical protein Xen7305DRAFT_00024220 [Xenococcus sp. PCC 7305]|uniref:plasmid replication protein, CyRepA1 family n=1 Tax=Xenococcus sp. PCC 7305 TaxID=102125 RepID=UPI0002AC570E|nr:plasmid replication protein, CyRepA1 family [Xenococcus sp. PCC 7305]ELS02704.1 hypothetical protein Xen7305DRAFT_00024220 [Xenococcus sp. PCC 7305]